MPEPASTLLKFPCDFPLKVMGHAADDFDALVVEIVRRHVPSLREGAVQRRPSRQGNYLAVTVTVQAESQQQLDDLYRELSGHARILMVL
ncbi:MAG: YbeD family protein [Gammaproteobacteria bacterium]